MIHIHGGPMSPIEVARVVWTGRHAMVSFAHPDQLGIAFEVASTVCFDNGAFSAWKKNVALDRDKYYRMVDDYRRHPAFTWAVIPDVIDGDEDANDQLIDEWPFGRIGVPVWHLHESLGRLKRLVSDERDGVPLWPLVALGSSGEYKSPNSNRWWSRMEEALSVACDELGRPKTGLHGLRMLNPAIFTKIPFTSCDSTTVAINVGMNVVWPELPYKEASKAIRGLAYATRLESFTSPPAWKPVKEEQEIAIAA